MQRHDLSLVIRCRCGLRHLRRAVCIVPSVTSGRCTSRRELVAGPEANRRRRVDDDSPASEGKARAGWGHRGVDPDPALAADAPGCQHRRRPAAGRLPQCYRPARRGAATGSATGSGHAGSNRCSRCRRAADPPAGSGGPRCLAEAGVAARRRGPAWRRSVVLLAAAETRRGGQDAAGDERLVPPDEGVDVEIVGRAVVTLRARQGPIGVHHAGARARPVCILHDAPIVAPRVQLFLGGHSSPLH